MVGNVFGHRASQGVDKSFVYFYAGRFLDIDFVVRFV
jgi:hypothetical protein